MRQLGNAVPVLLAQRVASSVAEKIVQAETLRIRESSKQKGRKSA